MLARAKPFKEAGVNPSTPRRAGFAREEARLIPRDYCAPHGMIGTVLIELAGEPLISFELIAT